MIWFVFLCVFGIGFATGLAAACVLLATSDEMRRQRQEAERDGWHR